MKDISVTYNIMNISGINALTSTFKIDIKIFLSWCDEKSVGMKEGSLDLKSSGIEDPMIEIVNECEMDIISRGAFFLML